ncbi:acyl-CoA carboxylase epsilon subunit [Streptomyces sp. NPDC086023]|uniref:acyl-CoA carboxylase epsilon subunit n=1 Tax=Streptomyces sp. NPDC086023 TaxID=3365746 RepID=UPI0037D90B04
MIPDGDAHVRVVRGTPSEAELAALLLALTLLARSREASRHHHRGARAHHAHRARWDTPMSAPFHPCHSWRSGPHH